jgi:ribosomal protein S18 acetylase RimI-like enzyme
VEQGTIIRLETAQQVARASELLFRVFRADPLWDHVLPNEAHRDRVLYQLIDVSVRYTHLYGEVYATSPAFEGVATWKLLPARRNPGLGGMMRAGAFGMFLNLLPSGLQNIRRIVNYLSYTGELHGRAMPAEHFYLDMLGVTAECRGQGHGTRLLRFLLARADAKSLPVYLETQSGTNVGFYRKYGFAVVTDGPLPEGGPRFWTMLRLPQETQRTNSQE